MTASELSRGKEIDIFTWNKKEDKIQEACGFFWKNLVATEPECCLGAGATDAVETPF
jgi:hypothetical protein